MYLIVLYFIVFYCILLYFIVFYCILLYFIVFYCIVSYCIVFYFNCISLYFIVFYCTLLYFILLYCITQVKGDYNSFYRDSLRYLGCINLDELTPKQQQEHAFHIGLSALLGDKVHIPSFWLYLLYAASFVLFNINFVKIYLQGPILSKILLELDKNLLDHY